ncbi:DNA polymerase III subunit epsilon [Micrococcales bacterium 31B]|nr:DNA polymerase III subunit epsilon [Micrococcales bacterium 31B]
MTEPGEQRSAAPTGENPSQIIDSRIDVRESIQGDADTWLPRGVLGFDTETTGTDVTESRIVTAALVLRVPGDDTSGSSDQVTTWLIDPGVPIPQAATDVHGITTQHAREHGAPPATALEEIASVIAEHLRRAIPLVIFNATFDLRILEVELQRHGLETLESRLGHSIGPVIDPLVLDRAVDRYRKGARTLTNMCEHYGVKVSDDMHDAHVDVVATLNVLDAMLKRHSKISRLALLELHHYQIERHREWADHFVEYLRSKGKTGDDVARTWPR